MGRLSLRAARCRRYARGHCLDVLLDLLLTVHVAAAEAHAHLGPVAAVVGTDQLGVHVHHLGVLLTGELGAFGLEVLEQLGAHVLADLLQVVLVPGLLQGAVVIAGTGQEAVHVKARGQTEGHVAVGKTGGLRGAVALLELLGGRALGRLIARIGRLWLGRCRLVPAQGSEQEDTAQCQQGDQQEVHPLQTFEGTAAQQVGKQTAGQQTTQQAAHHAAFLGCLGAHGRVLGVDRLGRRLGRGRLVALAKGFAATKFLGLGDGCPKANGQDQGKQGQHLFHFDSFTLM